MSAISLARILIVDDEAALMRALRDTLRDRGYKTEGATKAYRFAAATADADGLISKDNFVVDLPPLLESLFPRRQP